MFINTAILTFVCLVLPLAASARDPGEGIPPPTVDYQTAASSLSDFSDLPALEESQIFLPAQSGLETQYGNKVALDGDTLVISSPNAFGDLQSTVDVFRFEDAAWRFVKTLYSPNLQSGEGFRIPALHGDTLVVGARTYCSAGGPGICTEGTAYVFERDAGGSDNWGFTQQLDGGFKFDSHFGAVVALDKDTAVVLASGEQLTASEKLGALYIFERSGTGPARWDLAKRIESDDSWEIRQAYWGGGIFIRGDSLLVFGRAADGLLMKEFGRDEGGPGNWGLVKELREPGMYFLAGAFDGDTLLVNQADASSPGSRQAQYLRFYGKNAQGDWLQDQEIPVDADVSVVAVDGPLAFAGSEAGPNVGYLLQRDAATSSWTFTQRLILSDDGTLFEKASSSSMSSGRLAVGSYYTNGYAGLALTYTLKAPINVGHAGAWYNPQTAGQGVLVDIEPAAQFMFLAWFTYTDAYSEAPGQQHWYTAQGSYEGAQAVLPLYESLGGAFGQAGGVETEQVGVITVSFSDCLSGQVNYRIDSLELQGTFPVERLIPGSGGLCEQMENENTETVDINFGMDGGWYDENLSGQGFLVDAHPNPEGANFMFIAWFTYGDDSASGQRWLTAQGGFEGSIATLDLYETTGGLFDDPKKPETLPVGSLTLDFTDCSHARADYDLPAQTLVGSMDVTRLLPGSGALCEELAALPD
jgi:hypothetical protein